MPESQSTLDSAPEPPRALLPDTLRTLYIGEDGHLYLAEGAGRNTSRVTWSAEDFAIVPGLPPMPGTAGDLEDGHVFAHPTASADGKRIAVFGLLPTLEEELWIYDGVPWEAVEEDFPYLVVESSAAGDEPVPDDVAGAGMVIAIVEEDEDEDDPDDEVEDDDLPMYWPGGKVYVVHTDGVQVWEPHEFDDGSPTHLEWAPDDRHLLVLNQEDETLQLLLVDAVEPAEPILLADGAPIFWSWQPHGRRLALRIGLPGEDAPLVALCDPLDAPEAGLRGIGVGGSFYVPAWHPDGSAFVFGSPGEREDEVLLCNPDGERLQSLFSYPGRGAFRWDSSGRRLGVAVAPEGHGAFQALELIDVGTGAGRTVWHGPFISFEWLGGDRELLICEADEESGRLRWVIVDAEGRGSRPAGPSWMPARESVVALHFFEQVGSSHPFVSADGRHVVYAGVSDDDVLTEGPGEDPRFVSEPTDRSPQILVTPLNGGPTVAIGSGRFGCFSTP